MARKDKTFSSFDLIRLWMTNLTFNERREVLHVFMYGEAVSESKGKAVIVLLDLIADIVPVPGIKIVLRVAKRIFGLSEQIDAFELQENALATLRKAKISPSRFLRTVDRALS